MIIADSNMSMSSRRHYSQKVSRHGRKEAALVTPLVLE